MKERTNEELLREIERLRERVAVLEKEESARKQAEAELLDANMRLSKALTELKRRQQQIIQQARLNALGQMTSGIAHDFNNALMPIQGFSEFLLNNPAAMQNKQELRNILKDINDAAKHATDMVRRLSSFYRPTDESEQSVVDVVELIDAAVALTRPRWKEEMGSRGISIDFRKEVEHMPAIACNEAQLREMFTNMILNSIDALPHGGTITIRGRREGKWLFLQVADTGVGMTQEVMDRCFEPFFTTKGRKGTGIGLSMVYGIVRGHGGQIAVESEEGKGATFTVHLPAEAPFVRKPKPAPMPGTVRRPLHVLVIDDELWSRNLMTRFFESQGHSVATAHTGKDGLRKFQKEKFDLIVTDRAMPDVSGDVVAAEMKKLAPGIPIIMVTGFGEIMKATGERPQGVDEILSKPLTRTELAEAIARVVT